jgi:hypothetical protein
MTSAEFAIVAAMVRYGLRCNGRQFDHQVDRLARHLDEVGDRDQAKKLREILDPPADPDPGSRVVRS